MKSRRAWSARVAVLAVLAIGGVACGEAEQPPLPDSRQDGKGSDRSQDGDDAPPGSESDDGSKGSGSDGSGKQGSDRGSGSGFVGEEDIVDTTPPPLSSSCGDGKLSPDEACDDGNNVSGDGCESDCRSVNPGYSCVVPGELCRPIARCGDGIVAPSEQCDDGNTDSGDGCSERCRVELGKKCEGEPSVCTDTVCGDGVVEGAEACDDGNTQPFDGCSSLCLREPNCEGLSCTSECGDGLVINEECDDGNNIDGDGCSSTCEVEQGFTCSQRSTCERINGECVLRVPTIFRDFPADHADFGVNCDGLVRGLVQDELDDEGRPVAASNLGEACITSAQTFAQWFRDGSHAHTVVGELLLFDNGRGAYVNRFGASGERFEAVENGTERGGGATTEAQCGTLCENDAANETQCHNACNPQRNAVDAARRALEEARNQPAPATDAGVAEAEAEVAELEAALDAAMEAAATCAEECATETEALAAECATTCAPCSYDQTRWCYGGERIAFDGNPLFFPLDDVTGETRDPGEAKVPEEYGYTGWPWEGDVFGNAVEHNFYFTSEVQYWFRYDEETNATLDFIGDDDVWVFINGKLAVDLGGAHVPEEGSVTINAQTAAQFGLEPGNVYKIAVFHAERKMQGSSFKLTLSGFEATPSECTAVCGDGVLSFGEECDDGENTGGYGECAEGCKLGEYCGDGIVNGPEDCDNGPGGGPGCPSCRELRIR